MLAEAASRLGGISNVRLVKLEKTGLQELRDGSFDVVYSTNAFDHLEQMDRWLYIREAFRVLRPQGRLYVDNTNIQSEQVWTAFAHGADLLAGFEPPAFQPRPTTGAELTVYAQRAGFENVRTQAKGSLVILSAQKGS
jgi:2-polyprenyl-3-methyl-5-hydroxy-6-metoxy-1,4-benzoquinol methylase